MHVLACVLHRPGRKEGANAHPKSRLEPECTLLGIDSFTFRFGCKQVYRMQGQEGLWMVKHSSAIECFSGPL